jgi:pyruvate/2-oxoglutarate dehydrogenase complex dihydrolipoamide acyltransferase (E2) component
VLHRIKLPKLGDSTQSVVIVEVLVDIGQEVAQGDLLFVVETDKVVTEVPSPVAGEVVETLVKEGDEVPTGAPIAVIRQPDEGSSADASALKPLLP